MRETRGFRQRDGDADIACGQFLGDDARGEMVRAGRLKFREDVVDGLENAPRAFIGLLRGENFGKLQIKVGALPAA